jgi:uncharacterized protein YdhG (YjbR/CyaY superfamily)
MSLIDDYLAKIDEPQRVELERVRKIIHKSVPNLEEAMSYGMPGFKYKGKTLVWIAAFKDHMSLFPTNSPVRELKDKLKNYKTSKGTIQFTLDNPLSESLIKEMVLMRRDAVGGDYK